MRCPSTGDERGQAQGVGEAETGVRSGQPGPDRKPLVSVIMIFLNGEQFIQEAIASVFSQTYDNWELLLVDDGSSDASTQVARQLAAEHHEKVRYLEHPGHQNRGTSPSRNLGIRHARGEYIGQLDCDDVWLPHILEQQMATLEAHPEAAMACAPTRYWYSWTGKPEDVKRDFVSSLGVAQSGLVQPPGLLLRFMRLEGYPPALCSLFLRRRAIEEVGGFEEAFRGLFEDVVLLVKLCLEKPVFVSTGCQSLYRQHPHSACAIGQNNGQIESAHLQYLNWFEKYLRTREIRNGYQKEVQEVLQKKLFPYRHPFLYRLSAQCRALAEGARWLPGRLAERILPDRAYLWLQQQRKNFRHRPPIGWVRFGSLRRLQPISGKWGFDRGLPIDRYYIESFIARHAEEIRGHVLEIQSPIYTEKFGAARVTKSDVLDCNDRNPKATILADLTCAEQIPSNTFDCIICTQTLQMIYDVRRAVQTLYRILKPGGVLLATTHGLGKLDLAETYRDQWHFTVPSARKLLAEFFPEECIKAQAHGNVLVATASLHGLAAQELLREELDHVDPAYEMLITLRAVKPRDETTCP